MECHNYRVKSPIRLDNYLNIEESNIIGEAKMAATVHTLDVGDYIKRINKVESMLEEIKEGLHLFDKKFHESVKKGERDIEEGRFTICKTEEDLDHFFASI